jgi:hypothetical protein
MKKMLTDTIANRIGGDRPGVLRAAGVAAVAGIVAAAGTYKLLRSAD